MKKSQSKNWQNKLNYIYYNNAHDFLSSSKIIVTHHTLEFESTHNNEQRPQNKATFNLSLLSISMLLPI